jgi:hypothetical protein
LSTILLLIFQYPDIVIVMLRIKSNRTVLALCANAFILLLILLAIVSRDGRLLPGSTAFGQLQLIPPTAPSNGLTVMPGQLSPNTWGCYVIDPVNQTLSVYQFSPGEHNLRLAAARDIQYDRRLGSFNTTPAPSEIKGMLERADEPTRAAPATNRSPEN